MLIVTPNPAIDRTIRLRTLVPGQVIRTGPGVGVAGGKGGNVARAARCLSSAATVLALVPEDGGDQLRALYSAEGFDLVAVPVRGAVRVCTAILEDDGRVTLLNEPGADIEPSDWARLMAALRQRLAPGEGRLVMACSGSLPPGAPTDAYAQAVVIGHENGREVVVDVSGAPLLAAIRAGADLVCPNLAEAEHLLVAHRSGRGETGRETPGHRRETAAADTPTAGAASETVHDDAEDLPERAMAAAADLHAVGGRWVVVTAGAAGAAIAGPGVHAWQRAPQAAVRNPIGAGDSFVAGMLTARGRGADWPEAIRFGVAAGSASVEQWSAGVVDPQRVAELARQIG